MLLLPNNFEMLTPAGLEVKIFVDPKEANNVPAKLKERKDEEVQDKENMLLRNIHQH